jgi:hypothetical protein
MAVPKVYKLWDAFVATLLWHHMQLLGTTAPCPNFCTPIEELVCYISAKYCIAHFKK